MFFMISSASLKRITGKKQLDVKRCETSVIIARFINLLISSEEENGFSISLLDAYCLQEVSYVSPLTIITLEVTDMGVPPTMQ